MAKFVFFTALALIALVVICTGMIDLGLWLFGQPTVSDWLRQHPEWFRWPTLVVLAFLVILGFHLFLWPKLKRWIEEW